MGFREREHLVPERSANRSPRTGVAATRVRPGSASCSSTALPPVSGERKKTAKRLEIRVAPVRRFRRAELEREVERYAAFLGVEASLTVE